MLWLPAGRKMSTTHLREAERMSETAESFRYYVDLRCWGLLRDPSSPTAPQDDIYDTFSLISNISLLLPLLLKQELCGLADDYGYQYSQTQGEQGGQQGPAHTSGFFENGVNGSSAGEMQ